MTSLRSTAAFSMIGLIGLTLLAFWPTYLSRPFSTIDGYTHTHAGLGALWLFMLLGQIVLVRSGRRDMHKALGRASYLVAPLFFLSALLLAHFRFSRMDEVTFAREAYTLYLPFSVSVLFLGAYVLALVHLDRPRLHGCFMLCTAIVLLDPVVARTLAFHVVQFPKFWHYQLITFPLGFLILFVLLRGLPAHSRDRRAFAWFAGMVVFVQLLWFVAPRTASWAAFADWFRQLPLT